MNNPSGFQPTWISLGASQVRDAHCCFPKFLKRQIDCSKMPTSVGWTDHRSDPEGMIWRSERSSLEMTNRALEARYRNWVPLESFIPIMSAHGCSVCVQFSTAHTSFQSFILRIMWWYMALMKRREGILLWQSTSAGWRICPRSWKKLRVCFGNPHVWHRCYRQVPYS